MIFCFSMSAKVSIFRYCPLKEETSKILAFKNGFAKVRFAKVQRYDQNALFISFAPTKEMNQRKVGRKRQLPLFFTISA